ncbi:MFS transporter small subunit [Notoacmeibacter ruber]|nr:hypothetical protein [Notoacmeibacter ruber]
MTNNSINDPSGTSSGKLALVWAFVGIPLAWGVVMTLIKAAALFT